MQPDPNEIQKLTERVKKLEEMHSGAGHYGIVGLMLLITMIVFGFCR